MLRICLRAFACFSLFGCVSNNLNTQNTQIAPPGAVMPVRPPPPPPPAPRLTSTARLANAKMITVKKTTTPGMTLTLASPQSLASDCSPLGDVDAKVIAPPDHGSIDIRHGLIFSHYVPGDPPYLCNARKTPATVISYRATPGYTGEDTTSVQVFFPNGTAPILLFHITVR